MNINQEITEELEVAGKFIENATYSIHNLDFLNNPDNIEDLNELKKYPFLNVCASNLWIIAILDLHKLLSASTNDKYRLRKILDKSITNYGKIDWKRDIGIKPLKKFLDKIDDLQPQIDNLAIARHKRIAHHDKARIDLIIKVEDLKGPLALCQKIHDALSFALNHKTRLWEFSENENAVQLTHNLIVSTNLKETIYKYYSKQDININTKELIDIIRNKKSQQ